ncbi:hypothetical protein AB0E63_18635 [Kribbella sp. NPDC026596]|uniref:hypothetical protein n=1 Tax=Kribbella sp. NPDC026596 TaxID=3155122 RepID=UPI00340745B2
MAGAQIPPTGRRVVGRGACFARFEGDQVVEFRAYPDLAGMMMELGLLLGAGRSS